MWVRTLAGGKAVYIGYNSVRSPSPSFLRKLERLARAPSTKRVIVDVRLNGGGDNTTYGPLTTLFGSSAVNKRGKLYLLTGRATFSAAANFAAELDRDTRAIIVGEPTGWWRRDVRRHVSRRPADDGLDGSHRRAVPRAQERARSDRRLAVEPDLPCRSHVDAVLRGPRSGARARAARSLIPRSGDDPSNEGLRRHAVAVASARGTTDAHPGEGGRRDKRFERIRPDRSDRARGLPEPRHGARRRRARGGRDGYSGGDRDRRGRVGRGRRDVSSARLTDRARGRP